MTDTQIKYGPWHFENGFTCPDPITLIDDYKSSSKLCLFITQTHLTPNQQKKNIDKWCKTLPELEEVKYLWLTSKVNQKIFDAICKMKNLKGLYIKWSGIKQLNNLNNLTSLKYLNIGSSTQIESIDILNEMTNLKSLELENLKKINDFSVIGNLTQLEGLGINGSMWAAQKIKNLNPVKTLKKLKFLTTINSRIENKSFDPILGLTELVRFNCSWNYPVSEFEKLKSMPNLSIGNVETSWEEEKAKLNIK